MSDETSSQNLKVTDRRMFTPDGELREEYRFLEQSRRDAAAAEAADTAQSSHEPTAAPAPTPTPTPPPTPPPAPTSASSTAEAPGPALGLPTTAAPSAGFFDLVAMLAEPASIYLGEIPLPDGSTQEDLEMARLHIDLLDVLRQKTAGNLSSQESAVLEDVVYQLKMRYVRKQG